ncbi:MAG: InlB B-repeat-containing protein, partial [Solobacterium sp.]|nr:InlB B-repeat-containing protein [Solobacterium sp.]
MKRIMSILTAVFMSVGLLSVDVKAEGDPFIYIGGIFCDGTEASGEGWSFSRVGSEATLTLSGANISGTAALCGIEAYDMNLTIVLIGSNTVTGTNDYNIGIYVDEGDLTIQGDGSLNVSGDNYGIRVEEKELTITGNCTVTATANKGYAMLANNGITIGEGLGIIVPENGRIHDDGQFIVNKDGDLAKEATIGPVVTITFDANGASSVPEPQTIVKGGKATEPNLYLYDNDLYDLEGWYETADFSGDRVDFRTKTFDSDTTLYAAWWRFVELQVGIWGEGYSNAPIEYITVNGARFPNKVAALVYDGPSMRRGCPISLDAVVSEGYGFVEVVKDSDGTHLSDELPFTNKNDDTSWDYLSFEIWFMFGPLKTITFVDEDGTVLQESEVAAGRTPEYTGDTPTKEADKDYTYTFDTWDPEITTVTDDATYTAVYKKKSSGSGSSSSTTTTTPASDSTWTDTSSTAPAANTYTPPVTPSYRPQPTTTAYTVWFETDGGTEIAYQTVAAGTTAAKPLNPEKEGYVFGGWYKDAELTEEFDFLTPINANTTVYAKWTEPEEEPAEIIPKPT